MSKNKKQFIKNVYYMLCYAVELASMGEIEEVDKEEFDNIQDLFAWALSESLGKLIKRGLYREYVGHQEDIPGVKGRIHIYDSIKNISANKHLLSCEFDELSENNLINQILKTSSILLMGSEEVKPANKESLKKRMMYFSDVDCIDPLSIKWDTIRLHRNNINYQFSLLISQLVIEGMLQSPENGVYKLNKLIDDDKMSKLFEKFILGYYSKEHHELKASASYVDWNLEKPSEYLGILPSMQTDITLSHGDDILIMDAKYYSSAYQERYDKKTFKSNNLYQIFTYVKNEAANHPDKKVSGMLMYLKTDEEVERSDFLMSGNKISILSLDLYQEFEEIRKQLDDIANSYFR